MECNLLLGNGFNAAFNAYISNAINGNWLDDHLLNYSTDYKDIVNSLCIEKDKNFKNYIDWFVTNNVNNIEDMLGLLSDADRVKKLIISDSINSNNETNIFGMYVKDNIDLDVIRNKITHAFFEYMEIAMLGFSSKMSSDNAPGFNLKYEYSHKICNKNLTCAKTIFSFNYDLLIYYVLVKGGVSSFSDGFGRRGDEYLVFNGGFVSGKCKLYFIHGAFHLVEKKGKTYKLSANKDSYILAELYKASKRGYSSINIFASDTTAKIEKILKNDYLKFVYETLLQLKGTVIIYGCSMGFGQHVDKDEHIWRQIVNAKNVTDIIIGIPNIKYEDIKKFIVNQLKKYSHMKTLPGLKFFKQEDYNIWSKEDWIKAIIADSGA